MSDQDFLKGFQLDDYDMDLGISFVDEQPSNADVSVTAQTVETISTKIDGLDSLDAKIDDIKSTLEGLTALLNFDEIDRA